MAGERYRSLEVVFFAKGRIQERFTVDSTSSKNMVHVTKDHFGDRAQIKHYDGLGEAVVGIDSFVQEGKNGHQIYVAVENTSTGAIANMGLPCMTLPSGETVFLSGEHLTPENLAKYDATLPPGQKIIVVVRYDEDVMQDILVKSDSQFSSFSISVPVVAPPFQDSSHLENADLLLSNGINDQKCQACGGDSTKVDLDTASRFPLKIYGGDSSNPITFSEISAQSFEYASSSAKTFAPDFSIPTQILPNVTAVNSSSSSGSDSKSLVYPLQGSATNGSYQVQLSIYTILRSPFEALTAITALQSLRSDKQLGPQNVQLHSSRSIGSFTEPLTERLSSVPFLQSKQKEDRQSVALDSRTDVMSNGFSLQSSSYRLGNRSGGTLPKGLNENAPTLAQMGEGQKPLKVGGIGNTGPANFGGDPPGSTASPNPNRSRNRSKSRSSSKSNFRRSVTSSTSLPKTTELLGPKPRLTPKEKRSPKQQTTRTSSVSSSSTRKNSPKNSVLSETISRKLRDPQTPGKSRPRRSKVPSRPLRLPKTTEPRPNSVRKSSISVKLAVSTTKIRIGNRQKDRLKQIAQTKIVSGAEPVRRITTKTKNTRPVRSTERIPTTRRKRLPPYFFRQMIGLTSSRRSRRKSTSGRTMAGS
ncbi:hypothetical protein HY988_00925 [Candidatus Micrarchaeota archaeon]|nr:hypothetical protein [Candidatus Micrarchaeota archaeon]